MKYQREMMSIDVFIKYLNVVIAARNENGGPPRSPLHTAASYGLCGKLDITAMYRMREFATQMPAILCYLCNAPIDGAPLVDFYFYVATEADFNRLSDLVGTTVDVDVDSILDLDATYLLVFACKKCWNKAVAYRYELTTYAEHAFGSKIKCSSKTGVTTAVINSKGCEAREDDVLDAVDCATAEVERLGEGQLIQCMFYVESK